MSRIEESISKLKRFKYHAIGRLELEDAIDNVVSWYEQMMKEAVEGTIFPTIRTKEIDEQMFDNIISRFNGEHFKYEMLQAMKRWLVELRKKLLLLNEAIKVEGVVNDYVNGIIDNIEFPIDADLCKGDKVKIIIVKED